MSLDFGEQIRRIANARNAEAKDIARGIFINAVESVIAKTPVDEGFARGSWVVSVNSPSGSSPNRYDLSDDGENTADFEKAKVANVQAGDTMFLVSNLPYMTTLEYGTYGRGAGATSLTTRDGYSIQAPNGMVRLTVREILAGLRRA